MSVLNKNNVRCLLRLRYRAGETGLGREEQEGHLVMGTSSRDVTRLDQCLGRVPGVCVEGWRSGCG